MRRVRWLVAAMVLAGCAGGTETTPDPSPGSVEISPDGLTLPVGGTGQLAAVARDGNGAVLSVAMNWSTLDPVVATVASDGLVSAHAAGLTRAIAAAGDRADTVAVLVLDNLTLTVLPADTTIDLLQSAAYTVVATNGAGDTVPPPPVVWSSSKTDVATISVDGVATGVGVGTTNIVATAGLISSLPAVLQVAAAAGPCFGITVATRFVGDVAWGFKAVDQETVSGGSFVSADDNGTVHAVMTLQGPPGPIRALWTGELTGASSASTTQKRTDGGGDVATYTSTSGVILPQPVIGMPKLSLIVDLQQCTYLVVTSASVATVLTEFGTQTNSVDIIAQIQFAGPVPPDWKVNGIGQANSTMGGHSIIWSSLNPDASALMPLGFAVQLFEGSPTEPPAGEASGGFHLTYSP